MFTNPHRILIVGLTIALLSLVGCSDEEKNFQPVPVAKLDSTKCLSEIESNVVTYLDGKMNAVELKAFWKCADRAVRIFNQYVQDDKGNKYSALRIYTFLKDYIFKSLDIPNRKLEPLLIEIMALKKVLLGGSAFYIEKKEVEDFRLLLHFLEKETLSLLPHIQNLNWKKSYGLYPEPEALALSIQVLEQSASNLGRKIASVGEDYSFQQFTSLLGIVGDLFLNRNKNIRSLKEWVPIIAQIKGVLIGQDQTKIKASEWQRLLGVLGTSYGGYLKWLYYINPAQVWTDTVSVKGIESISNDLARILMSGARLRKHGVIPNSEVIEIIKELGHLNLLPDLFKERELSITWLVVTSELLSGEFPGRNQWRDLRDKWMRDEGIPWQTAVTELYKSVQVGTDKTFPGINSVVVGKLNYELRRWAEIQVKINSETVGASWVDTCNGSFKDAWAEMACVAQTPWPLNLNSDGDLQFVRQNAQYTRSSLGTLNWERALIRLIVNGYGDVLGKEGERFGLSKASLEQLFFDFKPLMVQIGLVAEANFTFYERVYLEGNLFLSRSDGDLGSLNVYEGLEYLHYAVAGINSGGEIVKESLKLCPATKVQGAAAETVNAHCFRWQFRNNFARYVSHIPGLVSYVAKMTDVQWQLFEEQLEITVRAEGYSNSPIETSDIREMFVLMQYIETFIFRFDTSYSETVSLVETQPAIKIYSPTLAELIGGDPIEQAWSLETLLTYLLKTGESPFRDDPIAALEYQHWQWHPEQWSYEADRSRLSQILASLAKLQ